MSTRAKTTIRVPHNIKIILPDGVLAFNLLHNDNIVKEAKVSLRGATLNANEVTLDLEIAVDYEVVLDGRTKNFTVALKDAGEHSLT